jgi:DNA polymerase IV
MDSVRERFGNEAITRAVLVGRDPGWTPPLLPDLPGRDAAPP